MGGGLALAAAMGIGRFAYTPILPVMQHAVGLRTAAAGLLASANYGGYLLGAIALAVAPTAMPRRGFLLGSLIAVAMTAALMAVTTDLAVWIIVRFFAGVASAGVFVLASGSVLASLRREHRSSLAGWMYAGVGIGIAGSGIVVQVTSRTLGWRGDWLVLSIIAWLAVLPCHLLLPRQANRSARPPEPAVSSPFTRRAFSLLSAAYFLEAVGYIVTGTFLVVIVNSAPASRGSGDGVWIVAGLAAIPAAALWSAAATRFGLLVALNLAFAVQACGILLPILGGLEAAYASAIFFGGTFLGITALTLAFAGQLAPERAAQNIGLLTAVYGVGQIIGPVMAAALENRAHSFSPALIVASCAVFAGGALILVLHAVNASKLRSMG